MRHRRALRTFTLLIALTGASTVYAEEKAAEQAEEKPDETKETPLSAVDAEKLLAFFNELVDHAVKNAADCPGLAVAIDGVVTRHLNTIQMSWRAKKAKKTIPKDVQEKMDRRATELVGALRKCLSHPAVDAAFKRLKPPKDKQ